MTIEIKLSREDIERACRAYVAYQFPELCVPPEASVAWDQGGTVVWVIAERRTATSGEGERK